MTVRRLSFDHIHAAGSIARADDAPQEAERDENAPRDDIGAFNATPVFLGFSDRDPHVPLKRVKEPAEVLRRLGARVEKRIYPGLPHTIIRDELNWVEGILRELAERPENASRAATNWSG